MESLSGEEEMKEIKTTHNTHTNTQTHRKTEDAAKFSFHWYKQ